MGISGFSDNEISKFCILVFCVFAVKYLIITALIAAVPFLAYYIILGISALVSLGGPS